MQAQRGIVTTLRRTLPTLSATVAAHQDKSRSALGALVCEQFGFVDARGRNRRSGCMKALRVLEAEGHISLLEAQCDLRIAKPRLLNEGEYLRHRCTMCPMLKDYNGIRARHIDLIYPPYKEP